MLRNRGGRCKSNDGREQVAAIKAKAGPSPYTSLGMTIERR
jgi:hypothetical protein